MQELLSSIGGGRPVECCAQSQWRSRIDETGGANLRVLRVEQILNGEIELQAGSQRYLSAEIENDVGLGPDIGLTDRRVGTKDPGIQCRQVPGSDDGVDAGLHRVLGHTGYFLALTSLVVIGKTDRPSIAVDRNRCVGRSL